MGRIDPEWFLDKFKHWEDWIDPFVEQREDTGRAVTKIFWFGWWGGGGKSKPAAKTDDGVGDASGQGGELRGQGEADDAQLVLMKELKDTVDAINEEWARYYKDRLRTPAKYNWSSDARKAKYMYLDEDTQRYLNAPDDDQGGLDKPVSVHGWRLVDAGSISHSWNVKINGSTSPLWSLGILLKPSKKTTTSITVTRWRAQD